MSKKINKDKPMLSSQVQKIAARYVLYLMLAFAFFILLRGHNHPGGGFIGGLIAGSGIFFYAVAHGTKRTLSHWYVKPIVLLAIGLLVCLITAVTGIILQQSILESYWLKIDTGIIGELKLGTPLLFDTGVFLTVAGSFLLIIISIMEEYGWK